MSPKSLSLFYQKSALPSHFHRYRRKWFRPVTMWKQASATTVTNLILLVLVEVSASETPETASTELNPQLSPLSWLLETSTTSIVAPIIAIIEQQRWVQETGLRTSPLTALHDGDRYLVKNYSLGILPTFSLNEFNNQRNRKRDLRKA